MTFYFPNTDRVIPPADQIRVRHIATGLTGWTRSTSRNRDVGVQIDGEARVTWWTWSELTEADDLTIPAFPGNVARLPVPFRVVEFGA